MKAFSLPPLWGPTEKRSSEGTVEKIVIYRPTRKGSLETNLAGTLIWNFWPPDL